MLRSSWVSVIINCLYHSLHCIISVVYECDSGSTAATACVGRKRIWMFAQLNQRAVFCIFTSIGELVHYIALFPCSAVSLVFLSHFMYYLHYCIFVEMTKMLMMMMWVQNIKQLERSYADSRITPVRGIVEKRHCCWAWNCRMKHCRSRYINVCWVWFQN